jgi:hypothetical protein
MRIGSAVTSTSANTDNTLIDSPWIPHSPPWFLDVLIRLMSLKKRPAFKSQRQSKICLGMQSTSYRHINLIVLHYRTHTPIFDSVADALMEELQTNPVRDCGFKKTQFTNRLQNIISGTKVSPGGRRIIVEDIVQDDDAEMMDLDDSDAETESTPPKTAAKTSIFPYLPVSPRNLRITVVTPKSTPAKKRVPLSPLTTAPKNKYQMVIGKKFTVAGKKAIKAGIPKPGFNVYVDPDLRPVPQR